MFTNSGNNFIQLGNILIQWGEIAVASSQYTLVYPKSYKTGTKPIVSISQWRNSGNTTHAGRNNIQCPFFNDSGNPIGLDWCVIGIV